MAAEKINPTSQDVERLRSYAEVLADKPDLVAQEFARSIQRMLGAYERFMGLSTEVQPWTVLPAVDDGGEPMGYGIYVEGYEDEGWMLAGFEGTPDLAEAVVGLHNQEHDAVQEALYPPLTSVALVGEQG